VAAARVGPLAEDVHYVETFPEQVALGVADQGTGGVPLCSP
jgi:hypothetical protein